MVDVDLWNTTVDAKSNMAELWNATGNDTTGSDVSLVERAIEATILTIICILALIGNISLWIVIISSKHLCTTSNWLVLCLSTADLLVSGVNMPVAIYTIIYGDWALGDSACTVFGFITMVTFIASVMSLGTISINRYFMICHPSRFKTIYTKRNTGLFIAGTWALSVALASPPLFGWSEYAYLPGQSFCFCKWTESASYTIFMVLACFGGPCSAMSFSYIRILQAVRASKRRIANNLNRNSTLTEHSSSVDDPPPNGNKLPKSPKVKPQKKRKLSLTKPKVSFKSTKKPESENSSNNNTISGLDISVVAPPSNQFLTVPGQRGTADIQARRREKKRRQKQEELRLTLSLLVVIVTFIGCWFPFCITMFVNVFSHPVPRIPDMATLLLGFSNSCCNPIIYGLMNRKFKEGFHRLFCFCRNTPAENSSLEINSSSQRTASAQ